MIQRSGSVKILVTGADGYLGKGVVKQLLDDGYPVVATDLTQTCIDRRADIRCTDLFLRKDPYQYFGKPDVLIHMCWRDGFVHNSIRHINELPLHYQFISQMAESGTRQIAVMGSMHEVGFFEGSVNEATACNPRSLYGISKNALRGLTALKCEETDAVFQWLRGFYIVGNSDSGCSVFSRIVQAAEKGNTEFPFTMGLNQFDFLDYDVFCRYVADVAEQTAVNGIINICSGRPEKLGDRVERFIAENKLQIRLNYGTFPDRPYDSRAIWGDDSKIRMIRRKKEYDHV